MKFVKMHGLGNDYVYVDGFTERVGDAPSLARVISDRHLGVGSDGLILILPSVRADVRMEMYNADGSRSATCGNGIRCVAKFAVDRGLSEGRALLIETDAGVRRAWCEGRNRSVESVRVDMGVPLLDGSGIPTTLSTGRVVEAPLRIGSATWRVTCVSIGNPHAVSFVEDPDAVDLEDWGPRIERAREFPERVNVHFAKARSRGEIEARTWERGSGMTRACGSGACAVCVAGAVTGRTERSVVVHLPGGALHVEWNADEHVYLTGPAVEVFEGDWPSLPGESTDRLSDQVPDRRVGVDPDNRRSPVDQASGRRSFR